MRDEMSLVIMSAFCVLISSLIASFFGDVKNDVHMKQTQEL